MTLVPLRRATDDDALLRRARRGDRRARRILVRRHAQRAVELVDLLVGDGYDATPLATRTLDVAFADTRRIDDALVHAAVRVCGPLSSDLTRLVLVLTEVEAWSEEAVADLLGRPIADITELRATARAAAGVTTIVRADCRGWRLVVARNRATEHERFAGEAHLGLCRTCRRRDVELRAYRDRLRTRGAAATAVVAADVVAFAAPVGSAASAAGIAGAIFGKAGVAGVGAAAVAITIASAGIAAARKNDPVAHPHGVPPRPAATTSSAPGATGPTAAGTAASPSPTGAGGAPQTGGSVTVPLPTLPGATLPPLPAATSVLPLPTSNVTSLLPLPTVTPTSLLSPLSPPPLPLPSVPLPTASLPTASLPSAGSLLGH